ncbi:hypothetical protein KGM_210776B, partial [Danaus plexippus plexippus]
RYDVWLTSQRKCIMQWNNWHLANEWPMRMCQQ